MLSKNNWNLGITKLWPEWKALFSKRYLKEDLIAGLTVACIAIPLSLAIALASGVEPAIGLATAIIAGLVCALFGGTPLAVSGPAAAMSLRTPSPVICTNSGNCRRVCAFHNTRADNARPDASARSVCNRSAP